jgi:hypothetical protein
MVFDQQGREKFHALKQSNEEFMDVSLLNRASTFSIITDLLAENNVDSLPKRAFALDPVDGRYYYFTTLPIVSGNDVVGAVMTGTSVNTLMPALKSTSLADVVIYDANGQALATTLVSQGTDSGLLSVRTKVWRAIIFRWTDVGSRLRAVRLK